MRRTAEPFRGEASFVVEDERPLVLVICSEPERLSRLRQDLRDCGLLPVSGRSLAAAASLLSQVQINGCLLVERVDVEAARNLETALERYSPECKRLCIPEQVGTPLSGWETCGEEDLCEAVWRVLGRNGDSGTSA